MNKMGGVCLQAIVMVAMTTNQYVTREREDTLYILESDNIKMDGAVAKYQLWIH